METILGGATAPGATAGQPPTDLIKDSDTARFAEDVIQASMAQPVIVDFWAPWCGPCKQLGPQLEAAVTRARGAVKLIKIDIDKNQQLAAQLRIQSIPAVYAFFQGQPVDGFVGALPESEIKSFVERLAKLGGGGEAGALEEAIKQALEEADKALEAGETDSASALYAQVLQHDAENAAAHAGTLRCLLAQKDAEGAKAYLDALKPELAAKPEIVSVRTQIELAEEAKAVGPIPELMEKVARDVNDHQSRFELAMALNAAARRDEAADALIEIVRRNRGWNDEAARKQLVKFFEAWGHDDPATVAGRKRLSSVLFA